ncbi:MAG: AMP-binding protein [Alphaproteobacteria bacterium]|nr:AMP-binding protein [Alphaproteobacteria bacterium]
MHPSIHAKERPDHPAIIMASTGATITYRELDAYSNQGAQLFRKHGLNPGNGIAIFMENNAEYLPLCWAAQRSGLYFTCISSRLTAGEVEYIVKNCGAKVFITSDVMRSVAVELAALLPDVTKYALHGDIAGYERLEPALAAMSRTPVADETPGQTLLYSSGTTGRPKGVKRPLLGGAIGETNPALARIATRYAFSPEARYLSPAPLYHAAPLGYNLAVQTYGGTSIIMEHFDAEEALRLIEKHKATHSQWVPSMFVRMHKLPDAVQRKYDLSSMKYAIHAAAPCPVPVKQKMIEWWGPVIYEYYAGTEPVGGCAITPQEWLQHPGSVGRASYGELHIIGDDGKECEPGTPGTIYFAGGAPFAYHNDPKKTAEMRNDKGWATLGDVGYVDEEGYLYLTDRKAFMIISGGVNIYPQEAENVLITHPKVADVAVIGVPNEDFGEEVKAVVQPMNWADAGPAFGEELLAYCRAQLSPIKCPRTVDFERELPRHPTGKLYKRLIRDRYWGNRESRIV